MNNDELKKKIVDIIQMKLQECPFQPIGITYSEAAEYVADALIAAGIGDVEHERFVFKKAYMDFFTRFNSDKKFRNNFYSVTLGCQIGKFEDMMEKAEKELAEEGRMTDEEFVKTLVGEEMTQYEADAILETIKRLKAEHAAMRERLSRAVELPCKIGDKVYAIFPIEDELKILDGTFVGIEEVVSDFKGCMCAIIVRQAKDGHYFNTYWDLGQFNKTWWADKEIAESKLAEVMGNHGM